MVFEANVLHHVADREGVIREMARTSSRYVVLLEPNRNNPLMFAFSLAVGLNRGEILHVEVGCRSHPLRASCSEDAYNWNDFAKQPSSAAGSDIEEVQSGGANTWS